jgi:hypothetical protein
MSTEATFHPGPYSLESWKPEDINLKRTLSDSTYQKFSGQRISLKTTICRAIGKKSLKQNDRHKSAPFGSIFKIYDL